MSVMKIPVQNKSYIKYKSLNYRDESHVIPTYLKKKDK